MDQTRTIEPTGVIFLSELDQPIWAVATQSEVLSMNLTYPQAAAKVNENIDLSGIAIITNQAARRQLEFQEGRMVSQGSK